MAGLLRVFVLICIVHCCLGFTGRIQEITDKLWKTYLQKDASGFVNRDSWVTYLRRFQISPPDVFEIEVSEDEFTQGWMLDMRVSQDEAGSYFRILAVASAVAVQLTDRDCDMLVEYCDANSDGANDETEFTTYFPALLRPIPWAVMFFRYDSNSDGHIDKDELHALFLDWDQTGNGNTTLSDFTEFWVKAGYGDAESALEAFSTLSNNTDVINEDGMDILFEYLDTDQNGMILFRDFLQIDIWVNGPPSLLDTSDTWLYNQEDEPFSERTIENIDVF